MTITASIPFLVCIAGALIFILATNQKAVELGKMMFFAGLLVGLMISGHAAHL